MAPKKIPKLAPSCPDNPDVDFSSSEDVNSEDTPFYVEKILRTRRDFEGNEEFKIRWKGHGSKHDTWEPRLAMMKFHEDDVIAYDLKRKAEAAEKEKNKSRRSSPQPGSSKQQNHPNPKIVENVKAKAENTKDAATKEPQSAVGSRRPVKILKATVRDGKRQVLVEFENPQDKNDFLPFEYVKQEFPELFFLLYDTMCEWFTNDEDVQPGCDIIIT